MSNSLHTDVVSVNSLQVSANIGRDCWGRQRSQPVLISVHLHLTSQFLDRAGDTDSVQDSVHYGHLSKVIAGIVEGRDGPFGGVDDLVEIVTQEAFKLAREAVSEVRVVVDVPKLILLAAGFTVDVTTPTNMSSLDVPSKVFVQDLILAVIIGVNPPEREAKQRVITNLVFYECGRPRQDVDYPLIVSEISKKIESSSYLTLEKFVMELVRAACLSSDTFEAVTVRAQKPSALTFAHSSGVEITRKRASFVNL